MHSFQLRMQLQSRASIKKLKVREVLHLGTSKNCFYPSILCDLVFSRLGLPPRRRSCWMNGLNEKKCCDDQYKLTDHHFSLKDGRCGSAKTAPPLRNSTPRSPPGDITTSNPACPTCRRALRGCMWAIAMTLISRDIWVGRSGGETMAREGVIYISHKYASMLIPSTTHSSVIYY